MRSIMLALLAFLALGLGVASPAVADDIPNYGAESLILEEDDLPTGWLMDVDVTEEDFPAGFPNDMLLEEAGGDDIDTSSLIVESRVLRSPAKELCYCAIIDADMDEGLGKYLDAVKAKASTNGWYYGDLGDKRRVLIVAGPESARKLLSEKAREIGARNLGELAYSRLLSDFSEGRPGPTSLKRAVEYAEASEGLVGESPLSMTIKGVVHLFREEADEGIEMLRKHVDGEGVLRPVDTLRAFAYGLLGRNLLLKKEEKANGEALKWLTMAIGLEKASVKQARESGDSYLFLRVWGNHLHRMTSLVRLDRKEEAFSNIAPMMELGKQLLSMGGGWQQWFEHVWFWTDELEPLRADERFKKELEPFAPKDYKWDERLEKLKEAKKKRDEARAKAEKQKAEREAREKEEADKKDGEDTDAPSEEDADSDS